MPKPPRLIYLLNVAQRHLQQWMAAQHAQHLPTDGAAPSAAQSGVLFCLAKQDGMSMGELAEVLNLGPSGMSGLIQRMEALGWLQRRACSQDGRTQRVWLSASGQALLPALKAALADTNKRLQAGFSPAELEVVARWLRHVQQLNQFES